MKNQEVLYLAPLIFIFIKFYSYYMYFGTRELKNKIYGFLFGLIVAAFLFFNFHEYGIFIGIGLVIYSILVLYLKKEEKDA